MIKYVKIACCAVLLASCSDSKFDPDGFWAMEESYYRAAEKRISRTAGKPTDLVVIEYSLRRDPTKIDAQYERFVFIRALDKSDIIPETNAQVIEAMQGSGIEPREIKVYTVVFDLKLRDGRPIVNSVGYSYRFLNNRWAELVGDA